MKFGAQFPEYLLQNDVNVSHLIWIMSLHYLVKLEMLIRTCYRRLVTERNSRIYPTSTAWVWQRVEQQLNPNCSVILIHMQIVPKSFALVHQMFGDSCHYVSSLNQLSSFSSRFVIIPIIIIIISSSSSSSSKVRFTAGNRWWRRSSGRPRWSRDRTMTSSLSVTQLRVTDADSKGRRLRSATDEIVWWPKCAKARSNRVTWNKRNIRHYYPLLKITVAGEFFLLLSNETLGQWIRFYCARRVPTLNDDKIWQSKHFIR